LNTTKTMDNTIDITEEELNWMASKTKDLLHPSAISLHKKIKQINYNFNVLDYEFLKLLISSNISKLSLTLDQLEPKQENEAFYELVRDEKEMLLDLQGKLLSIEKI